jgi:hypothetical protein
MRKEDRRCGVKERMRGGFLQAEREMDAYDWRFGLINDVGLFCVHCVYTELLMRMMLPRH